MIKLNVHLFMAMYAIMTSTVVATIGKLAVAALEVSDFVRSKSRSAFFIKMFVF